MTSILKTLVRPLVWISAMVGFSCHPLPAQRGEFTDEEFADMALRMASDQVALIEASTVVTGSYHLLDTRPEREYSVSHLPGAKHVGYDDFDLQRVLEAISLSDTIVVYCSVGYRSGKIGERLQEAGYRNVYNLQGGLFGWANEARPLEGADGSVSQEVHGYDRQWSKWLRKSVTVVY